jgi:hypothetical protein
LGFLSNSGGSQDSNSAWARFQCHSSACLALELEIRLAALLGELLDFG